MKRWLALVLLGLPAFAPASEYQSTLIVQTGHLRESDLVVRNISDLRSKRSCLAFYVRTSGTSPVMTCYDAKDFGATISQVGHIKEKDIVIRKVEDFTNGVACMVAYVSTPGTSPSIACYPASKEHKSSIAQDGHLREGDLDVRRIVDADAGQTCLVSYVDTPGTDPAVTCYAGVPEGKGGLFQSSYMKEGDLVVRKISDSGSGKACLVAYVSTQGTSSHLHCFDE